MRRLQPTTIALEVRRFVAVALVALALGATSVASGQEGATTPAPNGTFVFPADRESNPVDRLLNGLKRYNTEEINLSNQDTVSTPLLVAHWKRLDLVATNLEQLERKGRLAGMEPGKWQALRHEFVVLFDAIPEIMEPGGQPPRQLAAADLRRKQSLIRIALVANHRFDLKIREVLGILVDAGVS